MAPSCAALIVEQHLHEARAGVSVVLAAEVRIAEPLAEDIHLFATARQARGVAPRILFFPELRDGELGGPDNFDAACDRLAVLEALAARPAAKPPSAPPFVIVATPAALLQPTPTVEVLQRESLVLRRGQRIAHEAVVQRLLELDYDGEALCEAPGQYAVRGGIIDIYPVTADRPCRLDFFGDEIEDIRTFDPVTQRSADQVESIVVAPPPSDARTEAGSLADHLGGAVHWLVLEPEDVAAALSGLAAGDAGESPRWTQLLASRAGCGDRWTELSDIDLGGADGAPDPKAYDAEPLSTFRLLSDDSRLADERLIEEQTQRKRFFQHLASWHRAGELIAIVLPRAGEEERVRELLREEPDLAELQPEFLTGTINEGFRIAFREDHERITWPRLRGRAGLVVVSETEIFGCRRRRRPWARVKALVNQSQVDQLLDFSELVEGEFVVHLQHGVAIYRGVTQLEVQGERREVLSLEFDDSVLLHVPLQESHLVSRYVGLTKIKPQLGRIGSGRWEKVRAAAERATLDYAARLLEVQARRAHNPGFAFPEDNDWQREFEATFQYRETPDQAKAIVETKGDMEKPEPMDRLVCGDVGFGKTEVAIRAAFKAVMGGKQVAVLVPTTVLAQQHFNSFRERMAGFPVVVEMVSRFRTRKEQARIMHALAEGRVDILIGTHRLIQSDVKFRDLGLVVIDEEQRFGVRHKEVFKDWRTNVDLLSMSATPIPRTLYMALTGARNLSVIETPPAERRPIQTVVKAYDEKLVVEVIRRELRRGGQVFYLHNRVQTIDLVAARLRELMPDVTFGVGHGQMDAKDLEHIMLHFINGRFQVLVCTTIIESGIDIPNCNTMIIEGADRFGLSQLYQLRGRVGRFRHQAYAYLLLHRHTRLLDVARKRLHAIRQHNQLGAGFRIAMRDLELRGAGNLLGAEQSGHIVGVGFELYCQLLRQSIARLKGEPTATIIRASVKLDFLLMGEARAGGAPVPAGSKHQDGYTALRDEEAEGGDIPPMEARIPPDYVPELRLRVDLYRRLAMAENLAAVRQLTSDLQDRFGQPPEITQALLLATEVRCLAEQKQIVSVETEGSRLKLRRAPGRGVSRQDDFIMLGSRFPRLTGRTALLRLREISVFLNNL
ncbi:MAG: transcription-repair coupling factor [Opitutaceae bacterium]|nr:transcription-repair coupling factor [Opitutaceae bacterium]